MWSVSRAQSRAQNHETGPRCFAGAGGGALVVSWHANSAPVLRARWQTHTGGRCTWPSAIRADTLVYHRNLESLFYSAWALMLLLRQKKWNKCILVWGGSRTRREGRSPSVYHLCYWNPLHTVSTKCASIFFFSFFLLYLFFFFLLTRLS